MHTQTLDIPRMAAEFAAAHPVLSASEQRLVLATFRLLGQGKRFGPGTLAEHVGVPVADVAAHLDAWPMVRRDEQGRVTAFGGLSLEPTSHEFEVDGLTLYTWCALDTLFLPELLGRPARVRSVSPASGEAVSLAVHPAGVREVEPADAVMSLHDVHGLDLGDMIGTFCCFVHFFGSEPEARAWAQRSHGTHVASIADGFEYGRLYNRARLGVALEQVT
jgi:alkylmercury lyase